MSVVVVCDISLLYILHLLLPSCRTIRIHLLSRDMLNKESAKHLHPISISIPIIPLQLTSSFTFHEQPSTHDTIPFPRQRSPSFTHAMPSQRPSPSRLMPTHSPLAMYVQIVRCSRHSQAFFMSQYVQNPTHEFSNDTKLQSSTTTTSSPTRLAW